MKKSSHQLVQRMKDKKYLFSLIFIFLLILFISQNLGVLINITPSMPIGLYIRADSPISRGDIIAFCLGEPYQTIGLQRGYLARGRICHGADPLIKQIIAIPGDDVLLGRTFIQVNDMHYDYATRHTDSVGRVLLAYPRGYYTHTTGYWVVGNHSPDSWDSRYWGSINPSQILYKLRPFLLFQ